MIETVRIGDEMVTLMSDRFRSDLRESDTMVLVLDIPRSRPLISDPCSRLKASERLPWIRWCTSAFFPVGLCFCLLTERPWTLVGRIPCPMRLGSCGLATI